MTTDEMKTLVVGTRLDIKHPLSAPRRVKVVAVIFRAGVLSGFQVAAPHASDVETWPAAHVLTYGEVVKP